MEESNHMDALIRKMLDPETAGFNAPPVSKMKARHKLERSAENTPDLFSLLAGFLNMKVKLYHAVIAFLAIWITLLLISDNNKPQVRDRSYDPYSSNIAAASNHSTVPSCIQTFILKK